MYVKEAGTPGQPTIVFLHGNGVSGWMWTPQVEALSDYHCLIPDLPGAGESEADGPFTLDKAAGQVAELIRTRATNGRAHLVGLSLGSYVALATVALAPELVDRVVVSGVTTRPLPGMGMTGVLMRFAMPVLHSDFVLKRMAKQFDLPPEIYPLFRRDMRQVSLAKFQGLMDELRDFTVTPALREAANPTLVAAGEKETELIRSSLNDLSQGMPCAQGVIAPGVGHQWSGEKPELFSQMIRAWIEDQPLPAELRQV